MAQWLKNAPITHRGLHDGNKTVCENTLSAVKNSIKKGHAIEVDLQWTADAVPVVFHDFDLKRLTGRNERLRDMTSRDLGQIPVGGTADTIPTLQQLLDTVAGKVGLVLELKGEDGKDDGFVKAVVDILRNYDGNAAIMSFDHHLLKDARKAQTALPGHIPLGLTAEGTGKEAEEKHRHINQAINAEFVSYKLSDLPNAFCESFRQAAKPVICWTVRTREQLQSAAQYSDQPTYELIEVD